MEPQFYPPNPTGPVPPPPVSPPPQPFTQPIVQAPLPVEKKFPLKKALTVLLVLVLVVSLSFGYFFWWVPKAQAEEFVEKTSDSFLALSDKVDEVFANFQKVKEESSQAQTAFSEITKTTDDYNYSKKDTQGDIDDINAVLPKIKEARAQIESLQKPEKVEKLATALEDYYSSLEETFQLLLNHEELQMKLLNAHGQVLYDAIRQQQQLTGDVKREDYVALLRKISTESLEAKKRTELISGVDSDEKDQFDARLLYYQDMSDTYKQAADLVAVGKDQEALDLFLQLSERVKKQNEGVQKSADLFVVESKCALGFAKLPGLEEKVNLEFEALGAQIPKKEGKEATGSAQVASPSAEPEEASSSSSSSSSPSAHF